MTKPDNGDLLAIGGAHPGAKAQEEIKQDSKFSSSIAEKAYRESIVDDTNKDTRSLGQLAQNILDKAEWKLSTFSDTAASPKYATDPSVSYLGAGTISIDRSGNFIISDDSNEPTRGVFSINTKKSSTTSSQKNTVLGTLSVTTLDGYMLNPVSPTFPSTNYSPVKPWIRHIFPNYTEEFVSLAVINLVVGGLLLLIDNNISKGGTSENITRKDNTASQNDIALIIQNNQKIEDELFNKFSQ